MGINGARILVKNITKRLKKFQFSAKYTPLFRSRVDGDRIRHTSGEDGGGGGGGGGGKTFSNGNLSRAESEKEKKKEEERKSRSERERKEEEARRRRKQMAKNAPPPIDFQSLLKMANEKKDQPVNLDKLKKKPGRDGEVRI